jgi:hypothetical protein
LTRADKKTSLLQCWNRLFIDEVLSETETRFEILSVVANASRFGIGNEVDNLYGIFHGNFHFPQETKNKITFLWLKTADEGRKREMIWLVEDWGDFCLCWGSKLLSVKVWTLFRFLFCTAIQKISTRM